MGHVLGHGACSWNIIPMMEWSSCTVRFRTIWNMVFYFIALLMYVGYGNIRCEFQTAELYLACVAHVETISVLGLSASSNCRLCRCTIFVVRNVCSHVCVWCFVVMGGQKRFWIAEWPVWPVFGEANVVGTSGMRLKRCLNLDQVGNSP